MIKLTTIACLYERVIFHTYLSADVLSDSLYVTQGITLGNHPDTPIHNVRNIVESEPRDPASLFCEMMYLSTEVEEEENPELYWEQVSRWIKYEQKVEGDGTRFSKPHITLLSLQSLIQLKNCLKKGIVILDSEATSFVHLVDTMIHSWSDCGFVDKDQESLIKDVLYAPKLHLVQGKMRSVNEMSVGKCFEILRDTRICVSVEKEKRSIAVYLRRYVYYFLTEEARRHRGCGSVVERSLSMGEVASSILANSRYDFLHFLFKFRAIMKP